MTTGRKRRKGQLSPEDKELWAKVTRTLTPLHPHSQQPVEPAAESPAAEKYVADPGSAKKTATAMRDPKRAPLPPPPLPLHGLEQRHRRQLVRGVKAIDARIDLHGLTQDQAHDRLRVFLHQAQARGHKVILVITGKGGNGGGFMNERGVLRRVVPQWLAMPDMRSIVLGYEEAHVSHGGGGALYVRIRKRR